MASLLVVEGMAIQESLTPLTIESSVNARTSITEYAVQEGDNPSAIAAEFGITPQTLLWANKLRDGDFIRPGDTLTILPVSGVKHVVISGDTVGGIAKKYRGEAEEVIVFNGLPADGQLNIGDVVIIPDGEMPLPAAPQISSFSRYANLPSAKGYYSYPTTGRNWGILHGINAVDVANACGTPIRAAAAGQIAVADGQGWNAGYGKYVQINHPNKTETLYAHFSNIFVSYGDTVDQGEIIGLMGTTGHSSGCHLHFEVHGAQNPLAR